MAEPQFNKSVTLKTVNDLNLAESDVVQDYCRKHQIGYYVKPFTEFSRAKAVQLALSQGFTSVLVAMQA